MNFKSKAQMTSVRNIMLYYDIRTFISLIIETHIHNIIGKQS